MRQQSFAEGTFEAYAKPTRRAAFLADMERVVPWSELCAVIAPHYPKGEGGRPTVGLERMLRIYFLQQWFNLFDPAAEEAIYDSVAMRRFVGIDLGREAAPDETPFCASGGCWRSTIWARSCSNRCTGTWKRKA